MGESAVSRVSHLNGERRKGIRTTTRTTILTSETLGAKILPPISKAIGTLDFSH